MNWGLNENNQAIYYSLKSIEIVENIKEIPYSVLASFYNITAQMYKALGKFQDALHYQLMSIKNQESIPDFNSQGLAVLYKNTGEIYFELCNYPEAIDFHVKCIDILNGLPDKQEILIVAVYISLSKIYEEIRDYDKAINIYHLLRKRYPDILSSIYYNNIGIIYSKAGKYRKAKIAFSRFGSLFPNEGRTYRNWAMFYALQNNKNRAIANLFKAIDLGYKDLNWILTDESLNSIRGESQYKEIVRILENRE